MNKSEKGPSPEELASQPKYSYERQDRRMGITTDHRYRSDEAPKSEFEARLE